MQDFLIDDNDDLITGINGELELGESTSQHQKLLLETEKGQWKENVLVGVGVMHYLENEDTAGLFNEIRKQFTNDGQQVDVIKFDATGKLLIDAFYKN